MEIYEVRRRFETNAPSTAQSIAMIRFRSLFADLSEEVIKSTKSSREQSLAITALEESKFWVNQGIIHNGAIDE